MQLLGTGVNNVVLYGDRVMCTANLHVGVVTCTTAHEPILLWYVPHVMCPDSNSYSGSGMR